MSTDTAAMTSHRPYLLRALYEWIADNGMTPHLLVDATRAGVQVPLSAVKDGRIVLNVAERAVARLEMTNEHIRFNARFGGVSHSVSVPISAVLAIYARETGQGMALPDELVADADHDTQSEGAERTPGEAPAMPASDAPASTSPPRLSAVPSTPNDDTHGDDDTPPPPPRGGGFKLRVVK